MTMLLITGPFSVLSHQQRLLSLALTLPLPSLPSRVRTCLPEWLP